MGRMLVEAVLDAPDCALAGALDVARQPALGQDAGAFLGRATGVAITDDLDGVLAASQVLIDFTRPEGTLRHLAGLRRARRGAGHRHHRLQRRAEGRRSARAAQRTAGRSCRPT